MAQGRGGWHRAGIHGMAQHGSAQHGMVRSARAALFAPTYSIPDAWGIKPPQWDRTSGCRGDRRVPASRCGRRVAQCGQRDASTHRHLTPLPSRRCFSEPGLWPGWRSSGTHRPARTSPCSRRRAGASWHGSTSRRGRFVPATLPSPLCCTISPKMGSAAFLPLPGPAPPPPASSRGEPWGAEAGAGGPRGTGGKGAGHRHGGMKQRFASHFYY